MNIIEILEAKKRGEALDAERIGELVAAFTDESLPPYQMSAFLMAVWFQGMDAAETVALTDAMLGSGQQLDVSGLGGPTADKHSTGGVGDKVSLLLAPLAAACGLKVPMLSGRGLGHTGGTLDKLEAVPGYTIHMPNEKFLEIVADVGCAVVGQSGDIAPADGKIYALRDVTATVDCVPLITASILSKKLAAGPETIVIDLKTGSGAFMSDLDSARSLARALIDTVGHWDRRMSVVFSDMSQPLGRAVGHANEALEAFDALREGGRERAPRDLVALTEILVADMVRVAGLAADEAAALERVRGVWDDGSALECLRKWMAAQGGRLDEGRDDLGLDVAPAIRDVTAPLDGVISAVDCREIGYALADLGGARLRTDENPDLTVGIDFQVTVGQAVTAGEPLATLLGRDVEKAERAARRLEAAVTVAEVDCPVQPLILDRME